MDTNIENIDRVLVTESNIKFCRGSDIQQLNLTSDGIVEKYLNNNLIGTMPFSKLGVVRESKSLLTDGYSLVWTDKDIGNLHEANIMTQDNNDNLSIENIEQTKQELQQEIANVEEIQDLQDELEDKLDTLNENTNNSDEYILVVYTNINGNYEPDVCISHIEDDYVFADSVETAGRYDKELADKYVDEYNNSVYADKRHILKAVKAIDIDKINGLYENKSLNEDNIDIFPSSENTEKELTKQEIQNINLYDILSSEQIDWLQNNIGTIDEIIRSLKDIFVDIDTIYNDDDIVISIDKYVENLHDAMREE